MKITPQCVVALTWTLKDTLGTELDVLDEPVEFLVGGNDLLVKVQEALQGYKAGDSLDLHLEPEDAFGDFNDQLLFLEPRALFPAEIEEGMTFDGMALPEGCNPDAPRTALYTVAEIYPDHIVLDGNHPLAGIALRLQLTVEAVREATDGEAILPGHAYLPPGGQHMRVIRDGARWRCRIDDGPAVNRHKPAVDVLFRSVAQSAGGNAVGAILTGMGDDGARGLLEMSQAGAPTLVQDEATSVVWGMPGAAMRLGAAKETVPLERIAQRLLDLAAAIA